MSVFKCVYFMQALILQERGDPSELSKGGSGGGGDKDMDHVMMLSFGPNSFESMMKSDRRSNFVL